MIQHIYPNFLIDERDYSRAVQFWQDLWSQTDQFIVDADGWIVPWLGTGSPDILDGNPIFSAYSPSRRRGVRVIQHEPTKEADEIQAWLDRFGGSVADPESIEELVICCALSDMTARLALELMDNWIAEGQLVFVGSKSGLTPFREGSPDRTFARSLPFAA